MDQFAVSTGKVHTWRRIDHEGKRKNDDRPLLPIKNPNKILKKKKNGIDNTIVVFF